MTNQPSSNKLQRIAMAAVVIVASLETTSAKTPKHWSELREFLKDKYVTVVEKGGRSQRGRFVTTSTDSLTIEDGQTAEIPRDSISSLRVDLPRKTRLEELGGVLHKGYSDTFRDLFSPAAPVGIVGVPAVTAYAIVATPFCILGDIFGERKPSPVDIEIVP
jgi:hypothetical protein